MFRGCLIYSRINVFSLCKISRFIFIRIRMHFKWNTILCCLLLSCFFNGTSTPVRSHSRNSPSYCTQHVVTFCIRCVATHQYVEYCIRLFKFRKIGRKKYSDFHFHCDLFKGLNLSSLRFSLFFFLNVHIK